MENTSRTISLVDDCVANISVLLDYSCNNLDQHLYQREPDDQDGSKLGNRSHPLSFLTS